MSRFAALLATVGLFLYPVAVYFGMQYFQPRLLAALLFLLLLLRFLSFHFSRSVPSKATITTPASTGDSAWLKVQGALAATFMLAAIFYSVSSNDMGGLKFYPLIVSLYLLASFSYSLVVPPTVIERIARLADPQLPEAGVRYTRQVTMIWCGFFVFNSLIVLYSIYRASFEFWALYNGFVSYLLIGCLLGGEYLYRRLVLKKDELLKDRQQKDPQQH